MESAGAALTNTDKKKHYSHVPARGEHNTDGDSPESHKIQTVKKNANNGAGNEQASQRQFYTQRKKITSYVRSWQVEFQWQEGEDDNNQTHSVGRGKLMMVLPLFLLLLLLIGVGYFGKAEIIIPLMIHYAFE